MKKTRRGALFITFSKPTPPGKPEPGGPVTTMAVGEEKGRPDAGPHTTMAVGEEGDAR